MGVRYKLWTHLERKDKINACNQSQCSESTAQSINNDPISQVFGTEHQGRVRGLGFGVTPTGVSADLSIVDLDVPLNLAFSVAATMNTYANLGVLAVVTWQVLFVSVPMVYFAISLQRYYFNSAKELMRINGTTKSMLSNHLAETIAGAMTIRAFKKEERFFAKNFDLIDKYASPFFHNFAGNEWLIQRLETLSAAVISSSALAMVLLPPGTFIARFIGMAFSYGLSLNYPILF
ncbi:hypothetical protein Scep_004287 [Stephania cephalantha]|uniref:ABC transmembrane type-1 domain-containing protein n=1 Tax=Stephania cephalantha TaxID=152367 RepID=A0AAP0KTN4_9MAGN